MRQTDERALAVLCLLLASCGSLVSCATLDNTPLFQTPITRFTPPEVPVPPPADGDCTSVKALAPGEARDCASVSVPAGYLDALREAVALLREETAPALMSCYDTWEIDRQAGQMAYSGCRGELQACRQARAEAFAAGFGLGFGTGAGGCAGIVAGAR